MAATFGILTNKTNIEDVLVYHQHVCTDFSQRFDIFVLCMIHNVLNNLLWQKLRGPTQKTNDGGGGGAGSDRGSYIIYPKISQLQNLSTQKNHYIHF